MGNLNLKGMLNFKGNLTLQGASGGKVTVNNIEALVQREDASGTPQGNAPPVIMPPPPAAPKDPAPTVWVLNSFNQTVKAATRPLVSQGMVMQGMTGAPSWPGMMLPSSMNSGPVSVNMIPINVLGDQAIIFPSGGTAMFNSSGQV